MELTAAIEALNALTQPCAVKLSTDSNYVRDGITKWVHGWQARGWRTADKSPVKNVDLWQALLAATARHQISWHWVKGHSGDPDNERADALANAAIAAPAACRLAASVKHSYRQRAWLWPHDVPKSIPTRSSVISWRLKHGTRQHPRSPRPSAFFARKRRAR